MKTGTITHLVELLHANIFTEERFTPVLDELRLLTNSSMVVMSENIQSSSAPELYIAGGGNKITQQIDIYEDLLTQAPYYHSVKLSSYGRLVKLITAAGGKEGKSHLMRNCYQTNDVSYICGLLIKTARSNIALVVSRGAHQKDYGSAEEGVLKRLAPHLKVAAENRHRLSSLQNQNANITQALELSEQAIGIIDSTGKLLFCSTSFYDCLIKSNLLASSGMGRFQLRSHRHSGWLRTTIHKVSLGQNYQPQNLRLSIDPLIDLQLTMLKQTNGAPLFLLNLKTVESTPQWWQLVYSFTPKEQSLIDKLLSGLSLPDAAEQLQVSHNTVRTHLHNILVKTNCSTQNQLLVTLLSPH